MIFGCEGIEITCKPRFITVVLNPSLMKVSVSDSWVLLSICACGSKGATLGNIIAVGDYINKAIMTKDELFGGLKRLHKAGLIFQKKDRYEPAPRVSAAYKKIEKKVKRGYLRQWPFLEEYLQRIEKKKPIGVLGRLTKKAYEKTVKRYHDGFKS
jgi:hypothetical protein